MASYQKKVKKFNIVSRILKRKFFKPIGNTEPSLEALKYGLGILEVCF